MLALRSYEQANGFSTITADELFYVNGGSGERITMPSIPAITTPSKDGWSLSNGGLTYTTGNVDVTISGTLDPSITVSVTIHF